MLQKSVLYFAMIYVSKTKSGIIHTHVHPQGETPYGTPLKVLDYGTTFIDRETFSDFIENIRDQYTEMTYDILSNNCNNFTSRVLEFLVGKPLEDCIY